MRAISQEVFTLKANVFLCFIKKKNVSNMPYVCTHIRQRKTEERKNIIIIIIIIGVSLCQINFRVN
jgi:hypothetical protein